MKSVVLFFVVLWLGVAGVAVAGSRSAPAGPKANSADHALIRALLGNRYTEALKAINQGANVNAIEGGK